MKKRLFAIFTCLALLVSLVISFEARAQDWESEFETEMDKGPSKKVKKKGTSKPAKRTGVMPEAQAAPPVPEEDKELGKKEAEEKKDYQYLRIHVIEKRMFNISGVHELAAVYGFTLNNKFKFHNAFSGQYIYHINEVLGLEATFGYAMGSDTNLKDEFKNILQVEPNIPDSEIDMFGHLCLQFSPFYGKFSVLEWAIVHYDFYTTVGLGMARSILNTEERTDDGDHIFKNRMKLTGVLGGGFRFFINRWVAIRMEFKDIIYSDQKVYDEQKAANFTDTDQARKDFNQHPIKLNSGVFNTIILNLGLSVLL